MAKRTRGSKSKVKVDLSGVESRKIPGEGIYNVKVESVESTESSTGNPTLKWVFAITDGEFKGMKLFENTSLQPQALFKLKNVLEGLGVDIPNKAFDIDLSELIGLTAAVDVVTEKYEGKKKAVIAEYIVDGDDEDGEDGDIEELIEDLEEDELRELAIELGMKKAKAKKADEDDLIEWLEEQDYDEVEEAMDELFDEEDDDYDSMSVKELKSLAKEEGIKVKKGWDKEDIIEALEEAE